MTPKKCNTMIVLDVTEAWSTNSLIHFAKFNLALRFFLKKELYWIMKNIDLKRELKICYGFNAIKTTLRQRAKLKVGCIKIQMHYCIYIVSDFVYWYEYFFSAFTIFLFFSSFFFIHRLLIENIKFKTELKKLGPYQQKDVIVWLYKIW